MTNHFIDFCEIGNVYYIIDNDCTYYSFRPMFGRVSGYASNIADAEIITQAADIREPASKVLQSISYALHGALDANVSEFQRFILAWSALEIFSSKAYDYLKKFILTPSGHVVNANAEVDLHEILMKKFERNINPSERFRVLGSMLCSWDWHSDWTEFTRLKNIRDTISHGKSVQIDENHVKAAATLLQKYMFAYIRHHGIKGMEP